ncbi:MAG: hypothetical protein IPJ14_03145 [Kineosporiaceae bacterium]|nr:hypothetical protein [Kineosporiaceae bacterium]MBK7621666.1 hypothetical protein [Kineosporiaceae bacterium]MBK8077164.1 hypothetical protein [Kineosporiaceae bacterium]
MTERNPASTTGEIVEQASTLPTVVPAPAEPVPAGALSTEAEPPEITGDAVPETRRADAPVPVVAPPRPVSSSPGLKSRHPRRPTSPVAVRPVRAPLSGLRQKIESTAALRESLDAKEAEAQDLRASIEQLRRELDNERGAPPAAPLPDTFGGVPPTADAVADSFERSESETTRRPWWFLMLMAVILAALLLALASRCDSSPTASTPQPSAGASAPVTGAASPAASSEPTAATGAKATPMPWPGSGPVVRPASVPATGPGIDTPGTHLEIALDRDGTSVDAYESLRLVDPRSEPLALQLPSMTSEVRSTIRSIQVELDGVLAPVTGTSATGFSAAPVAGKPYTTAVVRYQLATSVVVPTPARAGRISAVAVSLTAPLAQAADLPVRLHSADPQMRGVDCALAAITDRLCGALDAKTGLTALLPASAQSAIFSVQVDRTS